MKELKESVLEYLDKMNADEAHKNEIYPDRHTTIHKVCCKHCPSDHNRRNGTEDLESKDLKESFSKEMLAKEFVFVCAWRQSKLCKGVCDYFGIDQQFLDNLNAETQHAQQNT